MAASARCCLALLLAPLLAIAQPLSVCMQADNAPLSQQRGASVTGFDVRLAQAVADELQRPLRIVPWDAEAEADKNAAHEVNALLSSGVCDLASGYPLLASDLGPPSRATARVPDHPGAPRPRDRAWVPLQPLAPSRPYHASALGLVVRDPARAAATLAAPGDARIGAVAGTMAGTLLQLYRNGRLRPQLVGLARNEDALQALDQGRVDAVVVPLQRLDAWRQAHPGSTLQRAAWVHALRINIGFVMKTDSTALREAVDRVVDRARAQGDLERWAADAGLAWLAPASPDVRRALARPDLLTE